MAPLGVGMGAAILILVLFTGYRLLGTPLAWAVAAQALVAVAGLYALVRQTGVFPVGLGYAKHCRWSACSCLSCCSWPF